MDNFQKLLGGLFVLIWGLIALSISSTWHEAGCDWLFIFIAVVFYGFVLFLIWWLIIDKLKGN